MQLNLTMHLNTMGTMPFVVAVVSVVEEEEGLEVDSKFNVKLLQNST